MTEKIARTVLLGVSCAGLLIGAASLVWSPAVWGQGAVNILPSPEATQVQPGKINRTLSGSRTGVLTKAKNGTVTIDRDSFVLAPGALVENGSGNPVPLDDKQWDGVEYNVQYWLGTGTADRQITQMIIHFLG